ncbi:hypothetical protein, partial [Sphaerisporangium perillae]|uniref:hypothetical protein n=1 Tax=Sphaerisporangium perillae TaxID=2935860 RepID=UPI002010938B
IALPRALRAADVTRAGRAGLPQRATPQAAIPDAVIRRAATRRATASRPEASGRAASRPAGALRRAAVPRRAATLRRAAASRLAARRMARAAGMVSPMLWRQHRLYRAVRLQHPQAARRIRHAGLRWRSSGNCVSRHRPSCTSLDAVRLGTLWGLVNLKRRSGCDVVVTGGTETGHAGGVHSHGKGYKIDVAHNRCIDRYIRNKTAGRVRGDGARLFYEHRPQGSTVYANEPSHWDITFL